MYIFMRSQYFMEHEFHFSKITGRRFILHHYVGSIKLSNFYHEQNIPVTAKLMATYSDKYSKQLIRNYFKMYFKIKYVVKVFESEQNRNPFHVGKLK